MRTDLVLDALRMAARRPAGAIAESPSSITPTAAASTPAPTTPRNSPTTASSRSVGSVGDAYDNALAESFVDTFKTELIADRVWRTRSQLELAIVEYVGWFNTARLHESLGDIPPAEFEALYAPDEPALSAPASAVGPL